MARRGIAGVAVVELAAMLRQMVAPLAVVSSEVVLSKSIAWMYMPARLRS